MLRKIVQIDEARCDGCGLCIGSCAEGAIALVDGKARLVSDTYCDGLGACLGECPRDAIRVVEREADGFDEAAVAAHLTKLGRPLDAHPAEGKPLATVTAIGPRREDEDPAPRGHGHAGCPGSAPRELPRRGLTVVRDAPGPAEPPAPRQGGSTLGHWPVQLRLVPPHAPWLAGADLLLAADCVPFAYASFHADFLAGKALLVGCPKLDDNQAYAEKLGQICARGEPRSITVVRMEVPCCGGIAWAAREGVSRSGRPVPIHDVVVGVDGSIRQG